mgnify:FL=1
MTKIIPYERNQYALWYDEEPDFKTPTSNEHCLEGDRLLREGKYKEAVQSYLHGAYKEDPESLCSLGMCYEFELGVIENFDKAVHYYMAASRLGYLPAKNMLRCLLTDGECWFQKDLELGIGVRLDLLLMVDVKRLEQELYQEGFGGGKLAQANYYWYKLGEQWDPEEIFHEEYFNFGRSDSVKVPFEENSYIDEYFNQKGMERGYYWAYIDQADYYMEAEHRDVMKAMDFCLKVKKKNTEQFFKYLDQFRFEDIVAGRETEAFQYFLKSALRKNVHAYEALAKCYEQGIGVQKDMEKAQQWSKKGK